MRPVLAVISRLFRYLATLRARFAFAPRLQAVALSLAPQ
jgi:hypothetical protein